MTDAQARGRKLFFAIFTISGFSGLIYESIWSHYLKLFLGHAAYAQTLVLAIFMGGMALGSWIMSRKSARMLNLLIGYAIVEGVIGVLGLIFHKTSIFVTSWAFDVLLPNLGSPILVQLSKWVLGALLILPQSILLGMTFPLMSGAIVRRYPQRAGETLAMLYFTNSLGAAIGVLVSGFYLMDAVGLPGTIMTAGLLNVALALTVWGVVKYQPEAVQPALQAPDATTAGKSGEILRWMLIGAAVTGAAAFFYEIAWIRMLSLVLGSSTHSFELMLSAFILGIALGGLWVRRRIDRLAEPVRFLGWVMITMALVALVSLPIYNASFDLMAYAMSMFTATQAGYVGYNLASHAIAMLVMIPTTFFCGMTLPVMTHVLIRRGTGERAIGTVYAWNTAGAIVGVIIAVHLLMPLVGVKGIVIAGATLHAFLGVAYLSSVHVGARASGIGWVPAAIVVGALTVATLAFNLDSAKLSSGVFRHGHSSLAPDTPVLFLEHGKTATVSLVDVNGLVSIATNGKPDAAIMMKGDKSASDEITMILAGALPLALHERPARIANIGIGSGLTTSTLLASDVVQTVDTVEIEPLMARAAEIGFMPRVERAFRDPRSHIWIEDAKTFFAEHGNKYDVIVSEPSNPWVSGVSTLFSEEFYRHITRYLEPDGILVQWMQIYETNFDILLSVIKALSAQFDDFAIYNADDTNVLIVATRGHLPDLDSRIFAAPALRAELARVGIDSLTDIQARYLGNKSLLAPLLRSSGVPVNSDYFPFVDLNAPRARIMKRDALEYSGLLRLPVPFFELLENRPAMRELTKASPNGRSNRDLAARRAVLVRDAITSSHYQALDTPIVQTLLTISTPAEHCTSPVVRRAWLDSIYDIGSLLAPDLSASELQPIWNSFASAPCARALGAPDARMFALLRAISLRDVHLAASSGQDLFASGYQFSGAEQRAVMLIATAASQIGSDDPAAAADLLREHAAEAEIAANYALAARWLATVAAARSNTAR